MKTLISICLIIGMMIHPCLSADNDVNPFDRSEKGAPLKGVAYEPLEIEVPVTDAVKTEPTPWYKNKRFWYGAGICTAIVATTAGVTYAIINSLSGKDDHHQAVVGGGTPTASILPTALASMTAAASSLLKSMTSSQSPARTPKSSRSPSPTLPANCEDLIGSLNPIAAEINGIGCDYTWNPETATPILCCEGQGNSSCFNLPSSDVYFTCPMDLEGPYLCEELTQPCDIPVLPSRSYSPWKSATPTPTVTPFPYTVSAIGCLKYIWNTALGIKTECPTFSEECLEDASSITHWPVSWNNQPLVAFNRKGILDPQSETNALCTYQADANNYIFCCDLLPPQWNLTGWTIKREQNRDRNGIYYNNLTLWGPLEAEGFGFHMPT